jgi:hypothetical protein
MKGNPAIPGGPSVSKPAWRNTAKVFGHVGFFFALGGGAVAITRENLVEKPPSTVAQRLTQSVTKLGAGIGACRWLSADLTNKGLAGISPAGPDLS